MCLLVGLRSEEVGRAMDVEKIKLSVLKVRE